MTSLTVNLKFRRLSFTLNLYAEIPGTGITVLLGPSGSGKTTLMRLIAGFEKADAGSICFGQNTWFNLDQGIDVPVRKRNVGVVFQDYALFQNMTVAQNIGYGVAKKVRPAAVTRWVERLNLSGLEKRYPSQLSGGQCQRVALARTLATNPDLLLLDEPFSAVDSHLRFQLRTQLIELVAAIKKPAILVTHDLEEARQVADWIGVITAGRLARFGAARDIFNDPGDYKTATVLGWRNLLPLTLNQDGSLSNFKISTKSRLAVGPWGQIQVNGIPESAKWLAIRAEHINLKRRSHSECALQVKVAGFRELGAVKELLCRLPDSTFLYIHCPWDVTLPSLGEMIMVHLPVQHLRVLGDEISLTGWRLRSLTSKDSDLGEVHAGYY
ncbi:MAG: ABC transporter ATP-binding protein [Hyphomicrobiaceae bacterium]|nr:ABC transporter ATP-binding protein [Hyphomicrobiaceae bacterium]